VHQIAPAELGKCQKLEKYFMSLIVAAGLNSLVANLDIESITIHPRTWGIETTKQHG
jgi:hypothetical protein